MGLAWTHRGQILALALAVALAAPLGSCGATTEGPSSETDGSGAKDAGAATDTDSAAGADLGADSAGAQASDSGALPDALPNAPPDAQPDVLPGPLPGNRQASLEAFAAQQLAIAHVPGCGAAITRSGKLVWAGGFGLADVAAKKQVQPDTLFMLASISKTATCAGAMRAVELGKLALDDDVNQYLPFAVRHPKYPVVPMTLRLLLTHFSGIADNWDVMDTLYVEGDSPTALGDFLHDYLTAGAKYWDSKQNWGKTKPGTSYDYSDIGVALAGYTVERATGVSFDKWCRDQVFLPLGMPATSFRLADLDSTQVALPYGWDPTDGYSSYGLYGYPDYPDGGLRTSPVQMARFLLMFAGDGKYAGSQILSAEAMAETKKVQFPGLDPDQLLTWYKVARDGHVYVGHNGGDRGVYAEMFWRPSDDVGVLLFCNGEVDSESPEEEALLSLEQRLFDEGAQL